LSSDVVQIRRFVVGLDQPSTSTSEYQRADAAPIGTLGNGILDSADTVQTRRYVAGLDTSRASGGPTAPLTAIGNEKTVFNDLWDFFFGTEIAFDKVDHGTGQAVTLRLDTASLNAAAVSFSLHFDSSVLQNPQIVLEEGGLSDSVLTVNEEAVESGRLGILIDSSGSVGSVLVTFEVAGDATSGETKVEFTDDLAIRSASDSFGQAIPVRFSVGSIIIK
jgi:hypothetical protein